jgi:ABC-type multidrug transport system ATPase subunit
MSEQPLPYCSPPTDLARLEVVDVSFLQNGPYRFSAAEGECIGLSGDSGVGKTLLLKAVSDLIPHRGKVIFDGIDSKRVSAPAWRRKVCMVPADPVWWHDRVGDHYTSAVAVQPLEGILAQLGFTTDVLEWEVSRLSTGEKQRLGLARTLLLEPSVLLLDEPTSGLDVKSSRQVETLIATLQKEKNVIVIWVSHDYSQLERVADRILKVKMSGLQ